MELVELGTLLEMEKGKKPAIVSVEPKEGFLPYVDIDVFEKGIIKQYTEGSKCTPCEDGDILIVCDGSRSGLVGKAVKGYVGSTLARISAPGLIRDYLYHFVQGKYALLNTRKKGTGTPHLNPELLKKQKLVVPDVAEQERIVARIEELFSQLDAGVETLKKTKAQLAVYRQAVLKEAFEGRLTIHVPVNLPLSWASSDETNTLPAIPEEWHYIALKYLGDLGRGKSKHRPRNDPKLFVDGKYPFIQTGDVKAATNCITTFTKQYGEFGLSQSKLWPKGTLCITIAANIAETAFLGIDACFPDSVVGFTPNESILAEYVRYFVESQKIRLWAFAPATAQKNINLDTLENLIVPYCSIDEQRVVISEIESRLSVCDSIEQTVDAALQQAEAMRQSILKDAFEGKLT